MLNSSTIGQWIPIIKEFSQLRGVVATSDYARLGLLATYGGIYLDADVLVAEPVKFLLPILDEHENVVYTAPGQDCRSGIFSSNFIATRPNSTLWRRAFGSLVNKLQNKCGGKRRHRVCCYAQNSTPITCRSPWGLTDYIMRPLAMQMAADLRLSVHCLGTKEGLTPMAYAHAAQYSTAQTACVSFLHIYNLPLRVGSVLWRVGRRKAAAGAATARSAPWISSRPRGPEDDGDFHFGAIAWNTSELRPSYPYSWFCGECITKSKREGPNSTMCCRRRGVNLECRNQKGYYARAGNFFGRWAYHLFESINGARFDKHSMIEHSDLAIAALYRRALGMHGW